MQERHQSGNITKINWAKLITSRKDFTGQHRSNYIDKFIDQRGISLTNYKHNHLNSWRKVSPRTSKIINTYGNLWLKNSSTTLKSSRSSLEVEKRIVARDNDYLNLHFTSSSHTGSSWKYFPNCISKKTIAPHKSPIFIQPVDMCYNKSSTSVENNCSFIDRSKITLKKPFSNTLLKKIKTSMNYLQMNSNPNKEKRVPWRRSVKVDSFLRSPKIATPVATELRIQKNDESNSVIISDEDYDHWLKQRNFNNRFKKNSMNRKLEEEYVSWMNERKAFRKLFSEFSPPDGGDKEKGFCCNDSEDSCLKKQSEEFRDQDLSLYENAVLFNGIKFLCKLYTDRGSYNEICITNRLVQLLLLVLCYFCYLYAKSST